MSGAQQVRVRPAALPFCLGTKVQIKREIKIIYNRHWYAHTEENTMDQGEAIIITGVIIGLFTGTTAIFLPLAINRLYKRFNGIHNFLNRRLASLGLSIISIFCGLASFYVTYHSKGFYHGFWQGFAFSCYAFGIAYLTRTIQRLKKTNSTHSVN